MQKFKNTLAIIIGCPFFIVSISYGYLAYLVRNIDETGALIDGLGRNLFITPTIVKLFLHPDSVWAGFTWFIADFVIFFGPIAIGSIIFHLLFNFDD
jgi:hypothetical protein